MLLCGYSQPIGLISCAHNGAPPTLISHNECPLAIRLWPYFRLYVTLESNNWARVKSFSSSLGLQSCWSVKKSKEYIVNVFFTCFVRVGIDLMWKRQEMLSMCWQFLQVQREQWQSGCGITVAKANGLQVLPSDSLRSDSSCLL